MEIDYSGEERRNKAMKAAREWAKSQKARALYMISQMDIRERGELYKSMRIRIKRKSGELDSITFSFPRQGIFAQLGVGKGTKVDEVGTTSRRAKPWITETFTQASIDELADKIMEIYGDDAITEIGFNQFKN